MPVMRPRSEYPTAIIRCPDCGVKCHHVDTCLPVVYPGGYIPHARGSKSCLEQHVKNLKREVKRLQEELRKYG